MEMEGELVRVELSDKSFRIGWVYTRDPETGSVILLDTALSSVILVFGQNVTRVCSLSSEEEERTQAMAALGTVFKEQSGYEDLTDAVKTQSERVMNWLERHRVPVTADGHLLRVNAGNVVVEPPYLADSCRGTNPIVLDRVQKLINSMPTP